MSRKLSNQISLVTIAILTLASLVISAQAFDGGLIAARIVELLAYALLTAFALMLSVPLFRSEISIAHAIGLLAIFSLPADIAPMMTFAIFIGGLVGSLLRSQIEQQSRRYEKPPWYVTVIHATSRVTLAHFAASLVYIRLFNASLPITDSTDLSSQTAPILASVGVYFVLYFLSFILQLHAYTSARHVLRENASSLVIILILPLPFAVLGASVAQIDISAIFFGITMLGAVLTIFGLFALYQAQQRLLRQLDEMRSLSVATQAMRGNLNLDSLLRTTYVQVSQLLDTKNFTVVLYNEIEMRMGFPFVIRNGEEVNIREAHSLPADYPLIEHIMETHIGLVIESDVNQRALAMGLDPLRKPFQSWLGVPLVTGNHAIGAFVVQSFDQRRFDNDDLRILNIIVASTSIAIENARLYSQKSIRAEQLATLNQVTALLTGTLAPKEVLDMVVSSASTIAESDAVSVYLFDESNNNQLSLARSAGLSDTFDLKPPPPLLATKMIKPNMDEYIQPQSLLIRNLDEPMAQPLRQVMSENHKRAFIEHPLSFGGQNLGVLVLYYNKPQSYHPEQIDMIQAFATQAAQAIHNAQRFESADKALEQRVEQLYVLAAMGRVLNAAMETNKIYDVVLTYALEATRSPRGFIAIYRQFDNLYVPAQQGYPADMFADADFLQQGLTGRVLSNGQAMRISDTRRETGYLPLIPQTRSMLITPIMKGKDVLGIIMLESELPGVYSEGDGHFVAQIANQTVIAADNTQLFQRIREAHDNMEVILDAMQEGIILIDEHGVIVQTNPHISIIELQPEDLIGQSLEHLLADEQFKLGHRLGFSTPQALLNIINNRGKEWKNYPPHEYEIHDESFGVRYIQRQIIAVRDTDRHVSGVMLVFYNKSEEHELAAARESLSQMIVHDLRSPLTSVTTSLGLLQKLVPKDTEFAPIVEQTTTMSRRAIRKVLSRVDSLLDISKMESGEIKLERAPSPIQQVIQNVKSELDPLAEEHDVTISAEYSDDLPLLNIDADKVERMILNLVDNAIKYSPASSTIIVRALVSDPDFVRVEVVDNGPGIPDDYKQRLFDRYVQIEGRKTVRRGVGLGLTFCKLVTEAHGGDIWVADSNSDHGSVFKATLPIAHITEDDAVAP
ncbi:MAG: GAF domain-containing protein [Anaerolineae bacterium]